MNLYSYTFGSVTYLIVAQTTHQVVERMERFYSAESLKCVCFNQDSVRLVSCNIDQEMLVVFGGYSLKTESDTVRTISP